VGASSADGGQIFGLVCRLQTDRRRGGRFRERVQPSHRRQRSPRAVHRRHVDLQARARSHGLARQIIWTSVS